MSDSTKFDFEKRKMEHLFTQSTPLEKKYLTHAAGWELCKVFFLRAVPESIILLAGAFGSLWLLPHLRREHGSLLSGQFIRNYRVAHPGVVTWMYFSVMTSVILYNMDVFKKNVRPIWGAKFDKVGFNVSIR